MKRCLIPILILVACRSVTAEMPAAKSVIEGRVYELLADYQVNYQKVYAANFAFVGKGVEVRDRKGQTDTYDRWYLCVYEGPNRRLDACSTEAGHSTGRYRERWKQLLSYDSKNLYKDDLGDHPVVDVNSKASESYIGRRKHLATPYPLKQWISTERGLEMWLKPSTLDGAEFLLGDHSNLLEAKREKNGDIIANFKLDSNFNVWREIRFSHKERFLPVAVAQTISINGKDKVRHVLTRIDWKHHKEFSTPSAVNSVRFPLSPNAARQEFIIDFKWKVGSECKKKIEPDIKDWRIPFRELFDADWQIQGELLPLR